MITNKHNVYMSVILSIQITKFELPILNMNYWMQFHDVICADGCDNFI